MGNICTEVKVSHDTCVYFDGSVYTGSFSESGLREGRGELRRNDGRVYRGWWVDGLMSGLGEVESQDGRVVEGEFVNGEIEGEA